MINRVVFLGRIVAGPRPDRTEAGAPCTVVTLEVREPHFRGKGEDVTTLDARVVGEKPGAVWERYLAVGQDLLVTGRLLHEGGRMLVHCRDWSFVGRGVRTIDCAFEAYASEGARSA